MRQSSNASALGYHVTMRTEHRRGMPRDPLSLRSVARIMYRIGGPKGLLAFRVADTHFHALMIGGRRAAGEFARFVESSMTQVFAFSHGFAPARIRPVEDEHHLQNALGYLFRQELHHGTDFDPAHDGSSLPELVGLRTIGGSSSPQLLARVLPRLRRDVLIAHLWPVSVRDQLVELLPHLLGDACSAAYGLATLGSKTALHKRARQDAVAFGARFQSSLPDHQAVRVFGGPKVFLRRAILPRDLPELLRLDPRTVRRRRDKAIDSASYQMLLGQWALRSHIYQSRAAHLATGKPIPDAEWDSHRTA